MGLRPRARSMLVQYQKRHRVKVSMCSLGMLHNINPATVHHRHRGLFIQVTLNDKPANVRHTHNAGPALGQMMSQHWTSIVPMSRVTRDVYKCYIEEWLYNLY